MSLQERHIKSIRKKARRGFAGYPTATIAFYGPTDQLASKVAVGIVLGENQEAAHLERWFSQTDIRRDPAVMQRVLEFIRAHAAKSVVLADRILGCPHEEGIDYPEGGHCPACPFWVGRNRFDGTMDRGRA